MDSNFTNNGKDIVTSAFAPRLAMDSTITQLNNAASKFIEEKQKFESRERYTTGLNLSSAYLRPESYIKAEKSLADISKKVIKEFGTYGQIAVNRAMGSVNRAITGNKPAFN